jgi:Xaa-Pro aminopeptidase
MTKKSPDEEVQKNNYPKMVDTRLNQLYFMMDDLKVDGIAVTYLPNIRYLTNFSGSAGILIITKEKIIFITDDRYEEQVKTELFPLANLKVHITRDAWKFVKSSEEMKGIDSLAFESDRVSYSEAVNIRNLIRPLKFKPHPMIVEPFTVPKAPEELECIQKACDIALETFDKYIIPLIKPGVSEEELAIEIAYQSRKLGSERDPFDIIVVSGPRCALVHGSPSNRKIKANDIVIFDFGCTYNGFVCDITRTIAVGKATKEQKAVYGLLHRAKESAIENIRPGINGKIVDNFARSIIKNEGYGEFFQHSLGHGLGLVPHELPTITFRMDDQILPEFSVVAIEPGIYLSGKFGMRIEDNVFVTRNGAKYLTKAPSELLVL